MGICSIVLHLASCRERGTCNKIWFRNSWNSSSSGHSCCSSSSRTPRSRRSFKFLMEASILGNFSHGHATWACRGNRLVQARDFLIPVSLNSPTIRWYSFEVSASEQMNLIKQLRERTSAPIKHVKSALVDCKWDIDAAQKDLQKKKGVVLASKKKKLSRTAAEGLLAVAQSDNRAVIIELNCETDFVSRNDVFQHLALTLAKTALSP